MPVSVSDSDRVVLDVSLRVSIQRTLRIPDDGGTYPLPPSLGRLPIRPASQIRAGTPDEWRAGTHFIVPIHQHEAAWLKFDARQNEPRAVKIGVGRLDALTGSTWDETLQASPQNYIVCPYQPWLDGFKVGRARVRQFVAVPLEAGLTVEHQLTGQEAGGLTIASFPAKRGALPHRAPPPKIGKNRELGLGAGGQIRQRIYPDPFGIETWESTPSAVAVLHLIDALEYSRLTGDAVPPSPIDAQTYTRFGLPWFEVHDRARGDVPATPSLARIESIDDLTGGTGTESHSRPPVPSHQIRPIPPRSRRRR